MEHNHDIPDFPADKDKDCPSAEFSSADLDGKIKTATARFKLLANAIEAGVEGVTTEQRDRAARDLANMVDLLCRTYPWTAVQKGPAANPHNMERTIHDQRDEDPAETE